MEMDWLATVPKPEVSSKAIFARINCGRKPLVIERLSLAILALQLVVQAENPKVVKNAIGIDAGIVDDCDADAPWRCLVG